jgi:predicted nucleic acid-binding protein
MNGPIFVDTNVLVYAVDSSEPTKQPMAREWLRHLWQTGRGRLSVQVLNEYYWTVTGKLKPGRNPEWARSDVRSFLAWRPIALTDALIEGAWTAQDRFGFSFWDALIVAAARALRCDQLLTEDLQDGQSLDGLEVLNPFSNRPHHLAGSEIDPPGR